MVAIHPPRTELLSRLVARCSSLACSLQQGEEERRRQREVTL
eukprot:CAMPEP_0197552638 /NCGR_PEP_ID=MMETSP1320-20131121/6603_1 /TAXON_ID=91990 /ORGANISM="Bolidomonas sp., Strain RCC2347" /LENGTH=41 /DNA_ID= /DNA_START= /DNA_END= /DNA_ORIENTATION=